jgi:hypothetical protein
MERTLDGAFGGQRDLGLAEGVAAGEEEAAFLGFECEVGGNFPAQMRLAR